MFSLCSILCLQENLHLILRYVGMITIYESQNNKDCYIQSDNQMSANQLIMTFNRLH